MAKAITKDGKTIGVTVQSGDTLSSIASKYSSYISGSSNSARVKTLCSVNDIDNANLIYVNQKIYFTKDGASSGGSSSGKKTTSNKATIKHFGLQSDTDSTIFATWTWDKSNTDNYKVMWYYATGDGVWFVGNDSTTEYKQSTYSAPSNATKVKFKVKPISKKKTVNKKQTSYWTAQWSTEKVYNMSDNPPGKPNAPRVEIDKDDKLTASLDNIDPDINATEIQFCVYKNDKTKVKTGKATIKTSAASYSCTVDKGAEYKVRCRAYRGDQYGDWSEYSENVASSIISPYKITTLRPTSSTEVYIKWPTVKAADSYEIQYTTDKKYFDIDSDQRTSVVTETNTNTRYITGLESGKEYFFRVRARKEGATESDWTEVKSVTVGKAPSIPTTWSSATKVKSGDDLRLYWIHNSADGSSQTKAEIKLTITTHDTTYSKTITVENEYFGDEDKQDQTLFYTINTTGLIYPDGPDCREGMSVEWQVRTAGVYTKLGATMYSDWSVQRTVEIYAPIAVSVDTLDANRESNDLIEAFPFYISTVATPESQVPIGYHVSVVTKTAYETVDSIGNVKMVSVGDEIYSKYFDEEWTLHVDVSNPSWESRLMLSASDIDLENNADYVVNCTVTMNSGLSAMSSSDFSVAWTDETYDPNAEIGYDEETFSTHIRPYCEDEEGNLIDGVKLSVYRCEFDGTFVELATGIDNTSNTYITDPHPALDYARYRVVAVSETTGAVSYYDVPGYPIGEPSVIIQWDEEWSDLVTTSEDQLEEPGWTGSRLRLPYNIDISDRHSPDVALIEYVGRRHPVSYYGTQQGSSANWSVEIPKDDSETLYGIRQLAAWMGDVYVREPSGSGYWANITVSTKQTHCETTIPVTFDIVRVEGGA